MFIASPSYRENLLDNIKKQHLSQTNVPMYASLQQLKLQSNSYLITVHIAIALELTSSLAKFSK